MKNDSDLFEFLKWVKEQRSQQMETIVNLEYCSGLGGDQSCLFVYRLAGYS